MICKLKYETFDFHHFCQQSIFCGEFLKKFNLNQLQNFRIRSSYVFLGAELLAWFSAIIRLVGRIINLNEWLKICKFQKSKKFYSALKSFLSSIITQHLEKIMVKNVWNFRACCFPTFWEILRRRCAMRKNCKNLEFLISPKFSYKRKKNKNREISGLDLTTRNVGLSSRKVWAKSNFRPLFVKYHLNGI